MYFTGIVPHYSCKQIVGHLYVVRYQVYDMYFKLNKKLSYYIL